MKPTMACAALALVFAGLAASAHGADTAPATAAAQPAPALLPIRYQRTGGFAGTNDVIEITPAGAVVLQGKLMGTGKGQLTPEQMAKLAAAFADWPKDAGNYPAPPGSADGFEFKIRYGTVELSGSDMNQSLPANFKAVQQMLEQIARDVKGK